MVECRPASAGDLELRRTRSCYDLSPAKLFRCLGGGGLTRNRMILILNHALFIHSMTPFAAHCLFARFALESALIPIDRKGSRSFPRSRRINDRRNARGRRPS